MRVARRVRNETQIYAPLIDENRQKVNICAFRVTVRALGTSRCNTAQEILFDSRVTARSVITRIEYLRVTAGPSTRAQGTTTVRRTER